MNYETNEKCLKNMNKFGKRKENMCKSVKYLQNKHTNKQNIIIKNLTFINYTTKKTN